MAIRMQRPRGLAAVVAIGVAAPIALGLAWLTATAVRSPLQTDEPPTPLVIEVASANRTDSTPVKLTVRRDEPFQVTAPNAGVVTKIYAQPGKPLNSGDKVVAIDDRVRLAFVSAAPLWRDISIGMQGADVERLQDFLAKRGLSAGSTRGRVTSATVEGIRALHRSLGYDPVDSVLSRQTLLWVGPKPMPVAEVLVRVGDAIAPDTALLAGPKLPTSVEVKELERIVAPPSVEHVLIVNDAQVPYVLDAHMITDPAAVATVVKALGAVEEGAGFVRTAKQRPVGTIPVAAIVTDRSGRSCVFESVTGPAVPVEVSTGSLSTADVPVEWVGRKILANPRDVREELSCG